MGFVKAGYLPAQVGTTSVKIAVDQDGYIAQEGETPAGTKTFRINRVSAENDLSANEDVINFFLGLVGGMYDRASNQMSVSWSTDNETLPTLTGGN